MSLSERDKRKFPRVLFPCRLRLISQGHPLISHTENISEGGIRVILDENLKYYPLVGIELSIAKNKVISCEGRVVWVKEELNPIEEKAVMFDTGIEFVDIKEPDRKYIKKLVDKILSKTEDS